MFFKYRHTNDTWLTLRIALVRNCTGNIHLYERKWVKLNGKTHIGMVIWYQFSVWCHCASSQTVSTILLKTTRWTTTVFLATAKNVNYIHYYVWVMQYINWRGFFLFIFNYVIQKPAHTLILHHKMHCEKAVFILKFFIAAAAANM